MRDRSTLRANLVVVAVLLGILVACDSEVAGDTDTDARATDAGDGETPVTGSDEPRPGPDPDAGAPPSFRDDPDCFELEVAPPEATDITCGYVEVPLHHDDPGGETIDLAVAVVPGSAATDHERPLLLLGGGPGEVMLEPFLTEPLVRAAFDVGPDLIVVDQRGVGSSQPALECPEVRDLDDEGLAPEEGLDRYVASLLTCRDRLADEGIDLGGFNHLANAADVDLIRQALGHEQIDLRGVSYGTQVALLAAQARPERIGRVVLSSPVDPTRNWVDLAPAGVQRAFDEVVAACGADAVCSEEFGDVGELLEQTLERLQQAPEEVTVDLPGMEPVTVDYTPAQFLGGLALLFYLPDGIEAFPAFTAAAATGDLEPLAGLAVALEEQLGDAVTVGMQFSMLCTGEGALVTSESLRLGTDGGPVEEHWIPNSIIAGDRMGEVCESWDVARVYDPADIVLDHDVPTLVVTGGLDHVTPPALGRSVDDLLSDSILIEVPTEGHAPLEALGPCGQRLVTGFLLAPTTRPDDTCAMERELMFLPGLGGQGG